MTVESTTAGMSQSEVAKKLGISRARVSQLERQAMEKLRKLLTEQGFKKEDICEGP